MAELRWVLLGLGLVIVAGIYVFTRFKPRLDRSIDAMSARREPTLGESGFTSANADIFDEDTGLTTTPSAIEAAPEPVDPVGPGGPSAPAAPPAKIVAIRLMSRDTNGFPGEKLILTMRDLGLRHGEFGIFHRTTEDSTNDFSVASLIEPGSFDLSRLKKDSYPGVSIFMTLPGERDGVEIPTAEIHVREVVLLSPKGAASAGMEDAA